MSVSPPCRVIRNGTRESRSLNRSMLDLLSATVHPGANSGRWVRFLNSLALYRAFSARSGSVEPASIELGGEQRWGAFFLIPPYSDSQMFRPFGSAPEDRDVRVASPAIIPVGR